MATLSDLRTQVARALRDTSNNVWVTAELDDLINSLKSKTRTALRQPRPCE